MQVIIYGKENCVNCEKSKMLCQIKSVEFKTLLLGNDYTAEELQMRVGSSVRSLPQIFISEAGEDRYIGGYEELRQSL